MADIEKIQPMGDSTQYTLRARTDSDGNVITDTYLKRSGGQMTGPLTWIGNDALPQDTNPSYFLGINAFADGGTTKWISRASAASALDNEHKWVRITGDTMTGVLTFNKTTNYLNTIYNGTSYTTLYNHNNGNLSLSAPSGGLYMGYYNTTLVNWLNGKMSLNSDGDLTVTGNFVAGNGKNSYYRLYSARSGSGGVHHEMVGGDADYGVLKIRQLSTEGSGGPGSFTAALGIFDERTASISGAYQPVFFINRTGSVTTDLFGINNSSGRCVSVENSGNININYNKQIVFYGKNNNTSPRAQMGYMPSVTGVMHSVNNANHQTSGAFYIWSNGCDAANDNGGIAIDNEGVTVFGAGDPASNFTGVFRVVNEDNVAGGAIFRVQKDGIAYATKLYGAVWNDYAEYRITKEKIEPGRCIREVGDDTLALTTERLMRGCEIISDTFGMAIGENDLAKTPTATSGRVLAYPYESLDEFKKHIGYGVCSGPNGTVSIMTEEEERLYPMQCIGTISAVPEYDIWQSGNIKDPEEIKVNGRVWIRIR